MKVKEVDRTANVAWSPASHYPIYLAMGTAAQQLDATFSTKSALEIYELNFQEPGLDMLCKGSLSTDSRFHKLAWGGLGLNRETTSGVVVAGCDDGHIFVYDPNRIISGDGEALIFQRDKHTGPVRALDFNPFQTNLLASGASDSEIFIWDLNNPNSPMSPGAKSQPADDVTCISWNCQVQHILASTFATRCVVWDLRKNEPIIKVSGSTSRMRCNVVTWHPEVATQMCLASEDDQTPFIQLWDLRFATSPLKTMENHQRGLLSLAWCPRDSDLLLSSGKDSRILCWNPNSNEIGGEVVCEIPTSNQWCFDVAWCPRNPGLISSCSFDGHVSIYSLMGSQQQLQPSSKIAEAFMGASQNYQPQNINVPAPAVEQTVMLKKPPKWLRRPVGGTFGFGGKLVTFEYLHPASNSNPQAPFPSPVVHISQVITEPQLVSQANQLENVLQNGKYAEFCELKIANSNSESSKRVWTFLRANFDGNPKSAFMSLLGHDTLDAEPAKQDENGEVLNNDDFATPESAAFDAIAKCESTNWSLDVPFVIPNEQDVEGSVARLLLSGKLEAAVDSCIKNDRIVDAILLGIVGGNGLLAKAQQAYFQKNANNSLTKLVSAIVLGHWNQLISTCSLDSWKEALAGALTYSDHEEFSSLCEILGRRLEQESSKDSDLHAALCYICAGNVPKLVECWSKLTSDCCNPNTLQELIEQVTILRQAMLLSNKAGTQNNNPVLASKLHYYSNYLAAQGKLSTALLHLQSLSDEEADIRNLRQRLTGALGIGMQPTAAPNAGYRRDSAKGILKPASNIPQQPMQNKQPSQIFNPVQQPYSMQQRSSRSASWSDEMLAQPMVPAPVPPINPAPTIARGHLSHKYPAYIPDASVQSQMPSYGTPYSQPSIDPSGFPQQLSGGHQPANYPSYPDPPHQYLQPQYPHPNDANPVVPTLPPPAFPAYQVNCKPGWNDPPPLDQPQNKAKPEYDTPAPITHPLFGGMPEQAPPEMNYYTNPNMQMYQAPNEPQGHHHPEAMYSHLHQQQQQQQQQQPTFEPPPPSPNILPPKPPKLIPKEHQILNDVFEELKNKCSAQNNNMQIKRKLEDVSRKLEFLYEKLRENELSPNTILGLHQIVQTVQHGDYASALNIHSQIVATGAFSEISGFMPGLKVLLQTSYQLAVRM